MSRIKLLALLILLFAAAPARAQNVGPEQIRKPAFAPNMNLFYMAPNCGAQANCFPIRGTGAFDCGVSWTTASPHNITLSATATRQFTAADVGTIAWGAPLTCGAVSEAAGSITLGLAQTTIASVIDATHATVTGSFLANCTVGGEGGCVFVWGDTDETSAVNAAFLAATTNANGTGCGTLEFSGIIFVSAAITNSNNCLPGPGNAGQLTRYAYGVRGEGEDSSILVPVPNTSGAACPSGSGMFFSTSGAGGAQGVHFRDFQVNGFGGSIASVPGTGCKIVATAADGFASNIAVMNEAINEANVVGYSNTGIAGEPGFSFKIEVISSATTGCSFGANTQNLFSYCAGGTTPISLSGVGTVYTHQSNAGFVGAGTAIASCGSSGLTWYSDHDQFYFEHAGQKVINTVSGCTAYLDDDQVLSNSTSGNALNIVSGAIVHIHNSIVTATGATSTGIANAGKVFNGGGNTVSGTTAGYSGAGTFAAQSFESGTVTCSSSAATITFSGAYSLSPIVVIQDRTTAGVVTQTSLSNTAEVVGCPGASDVLVYTVTPNPF